MPVGFEYYITLTPDAGSGKSVVLNSFVLNDYIEYFAINTSDQVTEWKIVRGTPTGTVLVSGTVTNHDGDVLTINTGMTLAQSTGDPLVLVLKRLVETEDDLGIDDINFDQITQLRHTATGAIPSGFTGSPLANVVIDETTKTVTADIPTIGPQGYLTIHPAVTIISTQVQGGKLVVTFD